MEPYPLEEQDFAILDAALNRRLQRGEDIVASVRKDGDMWIVNDMMLYSADCTEDIEGLKIGEKITYLGDPSRLLSNKAYPIAVVRDSHGVLLYESCGYRTSKNVAEINARKFV